MAEKFAFHQLGRNRAAVDRHEGRFAARPLFVDQARHQFLATTGFAADVDRRLAARQLGDLVAHQAHRRRIAQQAIVDGRFLGVGGAQAQGGADQFAQTAEVDRFGHEIEGAGFQGVDGGVQAAEGGDHGHRHLRVALLDMLDQLQPGAVGQAHVGQAQVEWLAREVFAGFLDVAGAAGIQLHAAKGDLQQLADIRFIVDDQGFLAAHAFGFFQLSLRGWAKVMRKQLPPSLRIL
ncbi:hypothetical protein D9M71_148040 [compost metagenome]